MKTLQFQGGYLIRLMRGEEVTGCLEGFLADQGMHAGTITGLGGVEEAELGFFDLTTRTYQRKIIPGNTELIHYSGNITLTDGKPFIHAHAVVSGPDFKPYAGHFFSAKVAITGEFLLRSADWRVERKLDEDLGLKLMDL